MNFPFIDTIFKFWDSYCRQFCVLRRKRMEGKIKLKLACYCLGFFFHFFFILTLPVIYHLSKIRTTRKPLQTKWNTNRLSETLRVKLQMNITPIWQSLKRSSWREGHSWGHSLLASSTVIRATASFIWNSSSKIPRVPWKHEISKP